MSAPPSSRTPHFGILLITLLAVFAGSGLLFTMQQFLPPRFLLAATGFLLLFVLLAAVANVSGARDSTPSRIIQSLVYILVAVHVLGVVLDNDGIALVVQVWGLVCVVYTVWLVLLHLLTARRVNANTIYAALCVYLLMGLAWALWYGLLIVLDPGSFREANEVATLGQRTMASELYYSLVTLTTLGYGDIVPVTPAARMSAALEAVTGQIYIVILVARLVGLNVAQVTAGKE
jgi:hypothetical protein